jgi:hypothetical protein
MARWVDVIMVGNIEVLRFTSQYYYGNFIITATV